MTSRVARRPISIPSGVEVNITKDSVSVKGPKGTLVQSVPAGIQVDMNSQELEFSLKKVTTELNVLIGTTRALINNNIIGVSKGFEKKLQLVGVGYRAQLQGKVLGLSLGFSHPVNFAIPEGITIEVPSQTEVVVKGISKQQVGQVASDIRAYRPPEPYKGKGVRYSDETIKLKETKKK